MEDSGAADYHRVQLVPQAVLGDVLQGPVPVVIVVLAEVLRAADDFHPGEAVERHAHVVFAAYPGRYLHLKQQPCSANTPQITCSPGALHAEYFVLSCCSGDMCLRHLKKVVNSPLLQEKQSNAESGMFTAQAI